MHAAKLGLILAVAPLALHTPLARAENGINLICFGVGEAMKSEYKSDLVWDKYDHKYRTRDGITTGMKPMETAVTIQIDDGDGRIRLPKGLVPPISSGGDDQHWWQLTDIQLSESRISAGYRLNGLNHPKLVIDRMTGEIAIKGFGQDFHGRCDKIDQGQRRF